MKTGKIAIFKFVSTAFFALVFSALTVANNQNSTPAKSTESSKQKEKQTEKVRIKKPENIVVSATKIETPQKELGSTITVITGSEIKNCQKTSVAELLRTVPALDVVQTGGPGRAVSVFIRGAKSEHTLVLIDGIEMNEPMSPGRSYDFANLSIDNLERIEIIRGPQSTLYGSDAIGGVINFITKKDFKKPGGFLSVELGSYKTFIKRAGLSGGSKNLFYSIGLSHWDTGGISAAGKKYGNTEKDSYGNSSISARFGFSPLIKLNLDFVFRYIDAKAHTDNFGGMEGDDPNNIAFSKQFFFRSQARLSLLNNRWEQKIGFSFSDHNRNYKNGTDPSHPNDSSINTYNGRILKLDWQNNLYLHKTNIATFGVEIEEENGSSEYISQSIWGMYSDLFTQKSATMTGVYFQDMIKLKDRFFATLGLRLDHHNQFGTEMTYRITSAYFIKQTSSKIKATLGTGFKAPTLFQLYSQYGQKNLLPEKSIGWDIGFEQFLYGENLTLGAVFFKNKFDKLIDFNNFSLKYINVAKAETSGIEIFTSFKPVDTISVRMDFTYTHTEDKTNGEKLLRRPPYKFGIKTNFRFLKKGHLHTNFLYVSKRNDMDFSFWPSKRIQLEKYILMNIALSYPVTENIHISGRIDNVLNTDYEEVFGYGTPGISTYAQIKWSF